MGIWIREWSCAIERIKLLSGFGLGDCLLRVRVKSRVIEFWWLTIANQVWLRTIRDYKYLIIRIVSILWVIITRYWVWLREWLKQGFVGGQWLRNAIKLVFWWD